METARGKSVLRRIAIGPIRVLRREKNPAPRDAAPPAGEERTPAQEWERFENARQTARRQLSGLYDKAMVEAGEESAAILEMHREVLADEGYLEAVRGAIQNGGATAEGAASAAGARFANDLARVDDPYLRERASDVRDASQRVVNVLEGRQGPLLGDGPAILVADSITPGETVQMDKSKLLGFATRRGSVISHTSILARTMSIPALVGLDFCEDWDGKMAVLDGYSGCLLVDPPGDVLERMRRRQRVERAQIALLQRFKDVPSVTRDGRGVPVLANISRPEDVEKVLRVGGQGIGLFHTDFIFLEHDGLPGEEEQFARYARVVRAMEGRAVVFSAMDFDTARQPPCFGLPPEHNPALGLRGIRLCLARPDLFKVQLRAILRAAALGRADLLLPMVNDPWEVRECRRLLAECREELEREGLTAGPLLLGLEIETPAAVLMAGDLAWEVDFLLIGTNDLTQYALAVDRQDARLDPFRDIRHPAVLELVRRTAEAGHRCGVPVGLCGELAADLKMTETLLRAGMDMLSVPPDDILPLRRRIRELDLSR